MLKKINVRKAQQNLSQLVEEVYYKGDQYIIEQAGNPMAAVVPLWQLEDRAKRRERIFGMVRKVWQATARLRPAVIEREVGLAVRVLRAKIPHKKA